MKVTRIRLSNFKSFDDETIVLGDLNLVIGANASGKTNFVAAFKFLRDIRAHGLENAISIQGGTDYLRNITIGRNRPIEIAIEFEAPEEGAFTVSYEDKSGLEIGRVIKSEYRFSLRTFSKKSGYRIIDDVLTQSILVNQDTQSSDPRKSLNGSSIIETRISKSKGVLKFRTNNPQKGKPVIADLIPMVLREQVLPQDTLFLEDPLFSFLVPTAGSPFSDIATFNFDTHLLKLGSPITGKAELDENAGNLTLILSQLFDDKKNKTRLLNLVKDVLDFVEDIGVERFWDHTLITRIKESYNQSRYLPASLVSDGTVGIVATLVALFFQNRSLTIIEEPERSIHPHLISRLAELIIDSARKKQIIITTHHSEFVKHIGIENLLLFERDLDGFSTVSRPASNKAVSIFLENEMGLDELYIDNLLAL